MWPKLCTHFLSANVQAHLLCYTVVSTDVVLFRSLAWVSKFWKLNQQAFSLHLRLGDGVNVEMLHNQIHFSTPLPIDL